MDSFDLFKQLTRGVRFTSKNKIKRCKPKLENKDVHALVRGQNNIDINMEIKLEEGDESSDLLKNIMLEKTIKAGFFEALEDDYIKEEIESQAEFEENNEDTNNINLLDNMFVPQEKKKAKKSSQELKKIQEIENTNILRKKNHIHVTGRDPVAPIANFESLIEEYKVPTIVIKNLVKYGFAKPTPIQMQSIPTMLSGRSLLACSCTGSGKTVAFLVPIIRDLKFPQNKGFRALILCPTRELAKQTHRECLRLTEGIDLKIHTMSKLNKSDSLQGSSINKKYDILISTPNRICYLIKQEPSVLNLENIEWIILDEADKLFDEGGENPFRVQFDNIFKACTNTVKKVGLFSATHTFPVAQWAKYNTKQLQTIIIGTKNTATDLIDQELLFVGSESGKLLAIRDLIRKGLQPPVLVFVQTKDRAEQLFKELIYDGINVDVIHSDRSQQQRDNVIKAFRENLIWVLICTDLMGRGIDFKGVNLVINYDFPTSGISYIHRIGRTGRAGRKGKAITYFTKNDTVNLRSIAQIMRNSGCIVPEFMLAMKKLSKQTRKRHEQTVPKREDIATDLNFKSRNDKKKLKAMGTNIRNDEAKLNNTTKTERLKKKSNKRKINNSQSR